MSQPAKLTQFRGARISQTDRFETSVCRRVLEYWRSKVAAPGGRPNWGSFNLMDIYDAAPHLLIKDVVDGGAEFRNRFWGTRLTDAFGIDATGLLTGEYFDPEFLDSVLQLACTVMAADAPHRVAGTLEFFHNRSHVRFESLHLPLDGRPGIVEHLVIAYGFAEDGAA